MTTMNNEDPAKCLHPQIIAYAVADEGPDHGKPSGLWACAECGRKFEPADHMREAIAAERERSHELLQAADHIRAGLEAELAALRASAASVQADQRAEIDAANAVIDMAYRTLLGEGQEDQGAAYDNACRILGDRIEAARALRKGMT